MANAARGNPDPMSVTVTPEPTNDELAAILSAYHELWPAIVAAPTRRSVRWRFSGRWWLNQPGRPPSR